MIGDRKPQRTRRPLWRLYLSVSVAIIVLLWIIIGHPNVLSDALQPAPTATPVPFLTPHPAIVPTPVPHTVSPAAQVYHVGQTQHLDNIWLTPVQLMRFTHVAGYSVNTGDEIVSVLLRIQNLSDQNYTVNLSDFVIQDSAGVQNPHIDVDPSRHRLRAVILIPHGHISGTVTFEVPAGDPNLQLVYSPDIINPNKRKVWRLGSG